MDLVNEVFYAGYRLERVPGFRPGLVSCPIVLAARPDHVHFNMLHRKDLSRIKEVWYCAEENKPVDRSDIVKGYEVSKGEYVVVEEEELKKIAPATATTMEILQFVREKDIDPLYFESSYYIGLTRTSASPTSYSSGIDGIPVRRHR